MRDIEAFNRCLGMDHSGGIDQKGG